MRAVRLRGGIFAALRRLLIGANQMHHNGAAIRDYHDSRWFLVPFPESKGEPYVADNLATASLSSFREAETFRSALRAAESRWSATGMERDISWRLHVAIWAAKLGLAGANPGDHLVELGTGPGFMAAGIIDNIGHKALEDLGVNFFLMDTFLPSWQGENSDRPTAERPKYYADGSGSVRAYFERFANITIVEGELPGSLSGLPETGKIAFLHVDLNSAKAEVQCLSRLHSQLGPGSVVLFDDSTNPGCEDQLIAHRSFAKELGANLLELPTGQAVAIVR